MKPKQKYRQFVNAVTKAIDLFWYEYNRFPVMIEVAPSMYSDFSQEFTEKKYGNLAVVTERYGYFIVVPNPALPHGYFNLITTQQYSVDMFGEQK